MGDITAGSTVSLYANTSCSGDPINTVSTSRNIPQLDLYDPTALQKDETRNYTVKIEDNCSSLGTTTRKQAGYKYIGETIAQVPRMSCMNTTTFANTAFANSPYLANPTSVCDAGDLVDPKKCNAWQGNGTFNPECYPTGHGTLQDPYRICTPEQLQEMDNVAYFNAEYHNHYRLGQTIDMTRAASWHGGD